MHPLRWSGVALILVACAYCFSSSARANSIPTRTSSGYGEGLPSNTFYTLTPNLNDLRGPGGTYTLDLAPPPGFNEEVLCPISSGCNHGGPSYGVVFETVGALAPGSQITVNYGPNVQLDDPNFNQSFGQTEVNFLECDPTFPLLNLFCMQPSTVPTGQCLAGYNVTGLNNSAFMLTLPDDPACIPSNLVFTGDEFVPDGFFPTFGTVAVTSPEPNSVLLTIVGLLGLPFLRARYRNSQS